MKEQNLTEKSIIEESFAIIDREVGIHHLSSAQYAIVRRIIHSTADFDYLHLLEFSQDAIASGIACLQNKLPIITDVTMVKQGVKTLVSNTFDNLLLAAIDFAPIAREGKTRTETGILECFERYPQGIYVIGNAPTALLALCEQLKNSSVKPGLIIGVPVGFVSVIESKQALTKTSVPYILVRGRKGGSTVAAAIVNALIVLAS